MTGDFSTNLQNALRHDQRTDQTQGRTQQGAEKSGGLIVLSANSVLISVNETNNTTLKNRLESFLVSQFNNRAPGVGNNIDFNRILDQLDIQSGKTLLVQKGADNSVSISAAPVGQRVAFATYGDGSKALLAIKPRVALQKKTFMRGLEKLTNAFKRPDGQTSTPESNRSPRVFLGGRGFNRFIDDPNLTAQISKVLIKPPTQRNQTDAPRSAQTTPRSSRPQNGGAQRQAQTPPPLRPRPAVGATPNQNLRTVDQGDSAPAQPPQLGRAAAYNPNLRTTDRGDRPPTVPRGAVDPPGLAPDRFGQPAEPRVQPQARGRSQSANQGATGNAQATVRPNTQAVAPSRTQNVTAASPGSAESPLATAVTTAGVQLGGLTQQVTQVVDQVLDLPNADPLTRSVTETNFVDLQVKLNGLKDSLDAAKVSITGDTSREAQDVGARIDTLTNEISGQIEFLNEVYRDAQNPRYLQPSDQYRGDDEQTVVFDNRAPQTARQPEPFDRTALSPSQLADYRQTVRNEINDVYQRTGLYQRKSLSSQQSVDKVVGDALSSTKRLFLHKLRNSLFTTASGFSHFQSGNTRTVAPANSASTVSYQVQTLFNWSKLDRVEGHYRPQHHDLLSNFAWLYAGLKNGDLSKDYKPKAVNLVLANPTNLPENSKLDADKLYRKGDRANGLSALGYELSFLLAAGFKVHRSKLDKSSGLTKVKLTPPAQPVAGFEALLQKSAQGFLKPDYQQPVNRELDVANFLAAARQDPGWNSLLQNL